MKYFKITNLTNGEAFYISSRLPNESPTHVAMSAHIDLATKYSVEEVSAKEFYGLQPPKRDFDVDDDDDWDDDDCDCFQ